jgi:hypothetical protein
MSMKRTKRADSLPFNFGDILFVVGLLMAGTGLYLASPLALLIAAGFTLAAIGIIRSRI